METTGIIAGNIIATIPKTQRMRKMETLEISGERNIIPMDKIGRLSRSIPESVFIAAMDPRSGRITSHATRAVEIMKTAVSMPVLLILHSTGQVTG